MRLLLIGMGFLIAPALCVLWLAATDALADFWRYAVVLGGFYVRALPTEMWLRFMVGRTLGYVAFNAALWALALWAAARAVKQFNSDRQDKQDISFNLAVALWGAASFAAVFASGRFFGHYFIQVLPALSLLGARGIELLGKRLRDPARRGKARFITAALLALFLFGFVRFHNRTAVLAYETITGTTTRFSQSWGMSEREHEAALVAAALREKIGAGEPLYIWGYALDVYWLTGCRPATRFLAPYYVTGLFPEHEGGPLPPDNDFWRESRALLIEDLKGARPPVILDVYGGLRSLPYPELTRFIRKNYREDGRIGPYPDRPFIIFRLKSDRAGQYRQ